MAKLNISIDESQLPVFADYYRNEKKKLEGQIDAINQILSRIDGGKAAPKKGGKRRGRPAKAAAAAATVATPSTGKKRGRKPGSKNAKKATAKAPKAAKASGAKRGRKPKVKTEVTPSNANDNG